MELLQRHCPTCSSSELKVHVTYATQHHGSRTRYRCADCRAYFSETKNTLLEGLRKPLSLIWRVLQARSEGPGQKCDCSNVWHLQEHGAALGATVCRFETGVVSLFAGSCVSAAGDRRG